MIIGDATAADLDAIADLDAQLFPRAWGVAEYRQELERSQARLRVVRDERGAVAGFIDYWVVADEVDLLRVGVDPNRQRVGLGRRLVEALVVDAAAVGARRITLEVSAGNHAALALYLRANFVEVARRRDYYGAGDDAVILQRDIVVDVHAT